MGLVYTIPRVKSEKIKITDTLTNEEIVIQIYTVQTGTRSTRRMSIDASQRYKIEKVRDADKSE